jgi:hypothetical protein
VGAGAKGSSGAHILGMGNCNQARYRRSRRDKPAFHVLSQNVNLAPSWMRRALRVLPFNLPNVFALVNAPVV